jgi:hypothetical protein
MDSFLPHLQKLYVKRNPPQHLRFTPSMSGKSNMKSVLNEWGFSYYCNGWQDHPLVTAHSTERYTLYPCLCYHSISLSLQSWRESVTGWNHLTDLYETLYELHTITDHVSSQLLQFLLSTTNMNLLGRRDKCLHSVWGYKISYDKHVTVQCSQYGDSVWAGRSKDLILVQATFSAPVQTDNGAHPASYTMGTGSSWEYSGPGVALTTHPHLEARLNKNRAIPLLFWPFMACYRLQFNQVLKMHSLLGFLME